MYIGINRCGRLIVAALAAMAGWTGAAACEDVAVLSRDARYIVLSGDTLEVRDVGSLRWLGIRGVDYMIPGSTLSRAALWTDSRFDLQSGQWLGPVSALVSLQDLGRHLSSVSELDLSISSDVFHEDRWVNDDPQDRMLRIHRDEDGYLVTLARRDLTPERQWRSPLTGRHGAGFSCIVDDRLVIGGLETRLVADGNELVADTILQATPPDSIRLVDRSLGCTVLVISLDGTPDSERSSAGVTGMLVDLSANEVVREFRYRRGARGLLFADGERYLQQDITRTPVPNTVGFSIGYTGRVRVIDTRTNEVLGETALDGSGPMSHLLCRNEAERVVLSDTGKIHLLDLNSLEIIATQPVPFDRYFVF